MTAEKKAGRKTGAKTARKKAHGKSAQKRTTAEKTKKRRTAESAEKKTAKSARKKTKKTTAKSAKRTKKESAESAKRRTKKKQAKSAEEEGAEEPHLEEEPGLGTGLNLAHIVRRLERDPGGWRIAEMEEALGVRPRTRRKYVRLLREHFTPWRRGDGSALQIEGRGEERRLVLHRGPEDPDAEASLLLTRLTSYHLARGIFEALHDEALRQALDEAYRTLWASVRQRRLSAVTWLHENLDRVVHVVPDAPKDYSEKAEVLRTALHCIVFRRRLSMTYAAASTGERVHDVEPLTVALYRGGLYLFARYPGRPKVYNFAIDRIRDAAAREQTFDYPEDYHPARHTERAFGIFVEAGATGRRHEVDLSFAPVRWLHVYLKERTWHPTQRFRRHRRDRLRLTFRVGHLAEVIPWVRSFGPDVEVLGPSELREAVAEA